MPEKLILHNKPTVGAHEGEAVLRVFKSGWLAEGKEVEAFEKEICRFLRGGAGSAAAFSSGSAALYVALVSLGVKKNDEVIIPAYVCSAVLNAIFLAGAKPVLVDIDLNDLNISYEETTKSINSKTKAIIVTHTFGMPADVDKFLKFGVPVIEDCAQAIGSELSKKPLGTIGKVAVFSFYASKPITTGYGGMIYSKDAALMEKIRDFREFDGCERYRPRFNFQMSDIQAAIGRVQLKKLPGFLEKRKKIAERYYKIVPSENAWPSRENKEKKTNYYRFLIRTERANNIKKFLAAKKINTIIPIETRELLHRYLGQSTKKFLASEKAAAETLSLPIHPSLSDFDVARIESGLRKYFTGR